MEILLPPQQVEKMYNKIENDIVVRKTIVSLGDLNDDLDINVLDALFLINAILANEGPSDFYLWLGDLNNDLTLDIIDVVMLINIILSD